MPRDAIEYRAEAFSASGVDHFDECQAALEVRSEVGMSIAVLALRTCAHTVGQRRFEAIEFASLNVEALVDDKAGKALPYALAHDAGLVVVHMKALLEQDGGGVKGEFLHT
jgi:hypothetical protein